MLYIWYPSCVYTPKNARPSEPDTNFNFRSIGPLKEITTLDY